MVSWKGNYVKGWDCPKLRFGDCSVGPGWVPSIPWTVSMREQILAIFFQEEPALRKLCESLSN